MTREKLEQSGYVSLTLPYILPEQEEILHNAVRSLQKTGRKYAVLQEEDAAEIWVPKADLRG
jgi:hypothetical protein